MLRVDDLKKSYGARTLFQGVSYHFPEGERVALVGANGAGKTTFLDILCGIEPADDGSVTVPSAVRIGYLPQVPNPNPRPTVLEECVAGAERQARLKDEMARALATLEASHDQKALQAYETAEASFRLAGGYALEATAASILKG